MRSTVSVPLDQADGLRRLFAASRQRFVPLASNPHVAFGGLMIERLVAAFAASGRRTLVVDAAERSPAPSELAVLDLASGIEPLSAQLGYLAARGLPLRHVDANGSTASFLDALADAAPDTDVVLVHASASDLARLFAQRAVRPIVLASDRPAAVTHAYASIKLLVQRARLLVHGLLLGAAPQSPRVERIVEQLAGCSDLFLGAVLRDWATIDPALRADEPVGADLHRLANDSLQALAAEPASSPLPGSLAAAVHATGATRVSMALN